MEDRKAIERIAITEVPHSWNALQHMVMAMADVSKNVGKKSFFGRDKGQEAYSKFLLTLKKLMQCMQLDGLCGGATPSSDMPEKIIYLLAQFSAVYPSWGDAYMFGTHFFTTDHGNAVATIERLRSHP